MSWLLFILPCFHRSEPLFFPIFQGRRSVCSVCLVLCVCPHIHLLFSVEAQMYILLILFPAVKLQWGIKDPPHAPLRACRKHTHTHARAHSHPYIHNGWSKTLQEAAQGNSCQTRADYSPPLLPVPLYLPIFPCLP